MMSLLIVFGVSATEPTIIFSEDFSAFTEGSEAEPSTTDISGYSGKLAQTLSGWSGSYIYEAGGMLKIGDGGRLQTTRYNMSANSGVVKVKARVRSLADYGMVLNFRIGYSVTKTLYIYDNQWHNLEFVMSGGTSYTYLQISPSLTATGILIDDLSVETSPDFMPEPTVNQPSKADGKSFTATWNRVSVATSYLLDVYSKKSETEFEYLLKDESVTGTSRDVDGLDETKTYYFTVRATNGTAISDYSEEVEVVKVISEVAAPVAKTAINISSTGFTALWESVADAVGYDLSIYKNVKLDEAGENVLLTDDFSGITEGTLSSVEYGMLYGYLDEYTTTPGWYVTNPAFASGYIALAPFGESGTLTTPYMDLSNNSGTFTAVVNMAEMNFGTDYEGASVRVDLVDYEGNVIEKDSVTLVKGFKDYEITFTKGAKNTAVMVTYSGEQKLFINSFTIRQYLPKDFVLTSFVETIACDGLSQDVTVEVPIESGKVSYSYNVKAKARTVSGGDIVYIYSESSNTIEVGTTSGVANAIAEADVKAVRTADGITVMASESCEVAVYSLSGAIIANETVAGTTTIALPTREMVIVKLGTKFVKM